MRNLLVFIFLLPISAAAQNIPDSSRLLKEVIIQAYSTGRTLDEVPASVGYLSTAELQRFNNTSILPAVNSIPGVRMEERSPGSYRFSIRGSLLRSPFGVRNVKVYWNGLPLTDGGGNTYLNLLDFGSIGSMEVIKGPGGSLYGAGTGGVLLLNSPDVKQDRVELSGTWGSYGLQRYQLSGQVHKDKLNLRVHLATLNSDGYRIQTKMSRAAFSTDLVYKINSKSTLSGNFFYTELNYGTPGGLTKAQYDADPKQARPAGGPNRGAAEQDAHVVNKTPYVALTHDYDWDERWSTRTGVFGSHSDFTNPTIRNYEVRDEKNAGIRSETHYKFNLRDHTSKIVFGGEYQYFKTSIDVFDNDFGVKGNVQTDDDLSSNLFLLFAQSDFTLANDFYLTLGGSVNFISYGFTRYQPDPFTKQHKDFNAFFSPRISLLKKISEKISVYGSISRGFSPPSLAEVRPSTNNFNNSLQAETGINSEVGLRGKIFNNKLSFDFTGYSFSLKETIVIQRAADGADYFVNAGHTLQNGVEATVTWWPKANADGVLSDLKIWNSYSYNHYRFKEYIQDGTDYSGNKLTGVPPTVNTSGLDVTFFKKLYLNITANYVDHIPLNDANAVFANEYFLMGSKLGFKTILWKNNMIDVFGGIDNALDKKYSLGNDLNAVGGRYFNAAAGINFYGGIKLTLQ